MISARPAEVDDRAVPGHWEGDLIIGLNRSAIGTLVERTTRFTMLLHLPRMHGYGIEPRVKNGPALAGYGAEAIRDAISSTITTLPDQLRRSLTWDRGKEIAQHAQLRIDTGVAGLLRRPQQPLAARHQREHQRAAAPVLPEGHRPDPMGPPTNSTPSPPRSTVGHARPSTGRHPPRSSTSNYGWSNEPVLRPPVESGQYTSLRFTEHLTLQGIAPSIGSVGDAYDNALMETVIRLYKNECIATTVFHHGPYKTLADVEYATAGWVDWYNHRRLHGSLGYVPPVEYEQAHYAALQPHGQPK